MRATFTRPIIRTNYGSRRRVKVVYAYDPTAGAAMVQFADGTTERLMLGEMEALEPDMNTYADLDRALRSAAREVVGE